MLNSYEIEDDLGAQASGAIEVVARVDGRRRWCYFMTLEALANCGDLIDGTTTRIHYASPYMIVVAGPLTEQVIDQALRQIDAHGGLAQCSQDIGPDDDLP